jgi:hypothetical protein
MLPSTVLKPRDCSIFLSIERWFGSRKPTGFRRFLSNHSPIRSPCSVSCSESAHDSRNLWIAWNTPSSRSESSSISGTTNRRNMSVVGLSWDSHNSIRREDSPFAKNANGCASLMARIWRGDRLVKPAAMDCDRRGQGLGRGRIRTSTSSPSGRFTSSRR